MSVTDDREAELIARIQAGHLIERPDEMTQGYRENLVNLLEMQADSELSGAFGYVPWIMKAPTIDEKLIVATIVKDEVRHATVIYRLLRDLGIDVEERVRQMDLAWKLAEGDVDLGIERVAHDKRVNIFYYPIETWADFVMFNFTMDRGAGHQLEDVLECSYAPWRRTIQGIMKEETMHLHHGDMWVERMAKDPATRDEIQAALDRWYPRVMNIFGRPNTPRNKVYRQYRLKVRDNQEVREAFVADVQPKVEGWGLKLPAWTPPWEKSGRALNYDEARDEARYAAG